LRLTVSLLALGRCYDNVAEISHDRSTALRSVVFIAIGWLLMMVLLPAALVAAGT
jgi:hypothetical protein